VTEGVKWLFSKFRPKQEKRDITNVHIHISPTTGIQIDPPEYGGRIYFSQKLDESGDLSEEDDSVA
jgi:hypothetical protein